jgi:hypothetical protein
MRDKIVEQLIEKYNKRSETGVRKYGTTLSENNHDNFFTHALEEAMDFSLYLMKIIDIVNTTPNNTELGEKIRKMVS